MPLICWRIWHCCPLLPAALRSFSSMAESNPLATLVQKVSEPLMNSLERGKDWRAQFLHLPLHNPEPHAHFGEEGDVLVHYPGWLVF